MEVFSFSELDPSVREELWARVMVQELLRLAKSTGAEAPDRKVESEAVRALAEIREVLDDPELDDPDCFARIDAIVDVFYHFGLRTRRHEEND